jgi:hypothetical protein
VSDTTLALVGDGEVFGSRQLDMGNVGLHDLRTGHFLGLDP